MSTEKQHLTKKLFNREIKGSKISGNRGTHIYKYDYENIFFFSRAWEEKCNQDILNGDVFKATEFLRKDTKNFLKKNMAPACLKNLEFCLIEKWIGVKNLKKICEILDNKNINLLFSDQGLRFLKKNKNENLVTDQDIFFATPHANLNLKFLISDTGIEFLEQRYLSATAILNSNYSDIAPLFSVEGKEIFKKYNKEKDPDFIKNNYRSLRECIAEIQTAKNQLSLRK